MECPRVCVIDSSPTIRETVAIILGDSCDVRGVTPDAYARDPHQIKQVDLLIVADDALSAEGLSTLGYGPPILWLQARKGLPPLTLGTWGALPRAFAPEDLRAEVQSLLSTRRQAQRTVGTRSFIDYPVVDSEASVLARRAGHTQFPVLICGQPGTGKTRLARAIHTLRGGGRFVSLSPASCNRAALEQVSAIDPGDITVFLQDVSGVTHESQQFLVELLDCGGFASSSGWHTVRVICATALPFEDLARHPSFDTELFYRLSVLPIVLAPLRDRTQDIPALVQHIAGDLARVLSIEPVSFTKRAIDRLMHYLWFGNVAELETVLTRTLTLTPPRPIDAEDLLFGYGRFMPRPRSVNTVNIVEATTPSTSTEAVDLIINELAHEFKNPMVTIKTIAQHLERLLSDEAGREEVARLTGDAVDRMDRALENLLQFTRFRAPAPESVTLNALLAACLGEATPTLSERRVQLNYQPPKPASVFVDSAQIAYAFENLVRVIVRGSADGQTLSVRPIDDPGAIIFEFAESGGGLAKKLAGFLEHTDHGAEGALPLGLVFARALIERNGGRLEIGGAGENATITVWLQTREEMVSGNGKTSSLNS